MITAIRKSFKSKIYKIILWVTILALAGLFSLPGLFKMGSNTFWFAQVNNETISQSGYQQKVFLQEERMNALRAQFGAQADLLLQNLGMSLNPKLFAQDAVIQDALLNQVVKALSFTVSDSYVSERLSNPLFVRQELTDVVPFSVFDQSGMIDSRALHLYLQRMRMTIGDFEQKIAEALKRHMLLGIVTVGSYVPEMVMKNQMSSAQKKFSVLTFSLDRLIDEEKKHEISSQDLKTYFIEHNKKYLVPEKRSGIVWTLPAKEFDAASNDKEIEDYYENNKMRLYVAEPAEVHVRHILIKGTASADREAAQGKAQRVRQEIMKDPKQFPLIASKESEDTNQVERGGLMPWFKRGEKELAFDKAAFGLKENGDVSEIIPTREGFEIIQRVDKKATVFKPLASVKKEIEQSLKQSKFTQRFVGEIRGLIEGAKRKGEELASVLSQKGFKSEKISDATKDSGEWATALFRIPVVNDTEVYINNDKGLVVVLSEIKRSYVPELEATQDAVAHDLYEQRAKARMATVLRDAMLQAKHADLSTIKNSLNASLSTTPFFASSDAQAINDLKKRHIPAERLLQLEKKNSVGMFQDEREGYVFKLDALEDGSDNRSDKEKEEMKKGIQDEQNRLFTAGFVASLYRSATIKINQSSNEPEYPIAYED